MSMDRAKLKALAEASGDGGWYASGDLRYCDDKAGEVHGLHHDDSRFIAAASPDTVLALIGQIERLEALLDTPPTDDWFEGVRLEAGHQIGRWGSDHDAGKAPADWFWLIGYLAQKAMTAQMAGDEKKARHHTISTGAAMLNWFRAIAGESTTMRPGISQEGPQQ